MFLSIALTGVVPATDLGYLLHKHPDKLQSFEVAAGSAHVFYPEANPERCVAGLLLEIDPIALVRGTKQTGSENVSSLGQYVNDRPYAASSMLAVAMAKVFRTAMNGRCDARPELAADDLELEIRLPALPCAGGGADLATRLFEPLGWQVDASPIQADPEFPEWGDSRYVDLRLNGQLRLSAALQHLYVLLPVLDNAKHYWVSADEVDKLVRAGEGWLAEHPEKDLITRRYLRHRRTLVGNAFERLAETDDTDPETLPDATEPPKPAVEADRVQLVQHRRRAVKEALLDSGAKTVLDLGAGDGKLTAELLTDSSFTKVVGVDVSPTALQQTERRLRVDKLSDRQSDRLELYQSSLTYRDSRLVGYDAAVLMEVIEHIDPPRLPAMENNVFGHAKPATVVVTTPNAEYNVRYEFLESGEYRHRDHRFEWNRSEFRDWAERIATTYGYTTRFVDVGVVDDEVGAPTQLAVFTAKGSAA